jgi:hypothetical protein
MDPNMNYSISLLRRYERNPQMQNAHVSQSSAPVQSLRLLIGGCLLILTVYCVLK